MDSGQRLVYIYGLINILNGQLMYIGSTVCLKSRLKSHISNDTRKHKIMKTSERFNNAIAALVKGFFKGTLAKGSCAACAVGNMIAYCNKITINDYYDWDSDRHYDWGIDRLASDWYNFLTGFVSKEGAIDIASTGYDLDEIVRIEKAFEDNTSISVSEYILVSKEVIMQDQYNGLMAVVDVLCEIEGIESVETKKLFDYDIKELA